MKLTYLLALGLALFSPLAAPTARCRAEVTVGGYLAAVSVADLDRGLKMVKDNDAAAFKELRASRRCVLLRGGLKVSVVERRREPEGIVKFRVEGMPIELWAPAGALSGE